jgi:cyclic nucleotide-binding protein
LQRYSCIQSLSKTSIHNLVFFMAQDDRQQESLETLKLINAASTALRLYPEESSQVTNSVETAYQGTKLFLRNNQLLRFSFLNGGYLLNGEPVDNTTRERLQLLTVSEQLQKMGLDELVFSKRFDRKKFKKILSVFSATPEQIHKAGGTRSFIEHLQLTEIFPEQYIAPGESKEEKEQKQKVDQILKELSGGAVRPEYILHLVGRKKVESVQETLLQSFQSSEKSTHIIATTTYSLLQLLHKDHVVVIAPAFSKMLENVSALLPEDLHGKVSAEAAALLSPYLDQRSALMLICQDFSTPFGEHFYAALLAVIDNETLASVLDWIKEQQEKGGNKNDKLLSQLQVVSEGYDKLVATPRGKQILALGTTREVLQKTEQGRKEKRVQIGITALAKGDLESLKNKEVCLSIPATIEKLLNNDKESVAAAIIQNVVTGLKEKDHEYRLHLAQVLGGVADKLAHMNYWGWLEKLTPVCLAWIRENETADRSFEKHVLAMQAMMNHAWHSNNPDLAERILNVFYHIRSGALEKSDAVRNLVGHVQDKNVDLVLLQGYLERCFAKPVDEMICMKILMQGPVAAKFLLDTLITSEKRPDRIRLLKILGELGRDLVPVLLERLPDPMPWFGKRNIIRLLAATGAEEDVEAVLSYASHEDLRVQQEMLQCIVRIGQASTEKYLLQVLPEVSAQAKVQVVKNLREVAGEPVVAPLADLLEECRLYSGSEQTVLALEISRTLGASGSLEAISVLQTIIDGGEKQFGQESVNAAELAILYLKEQGHQEGTRQADESQEPPPSVLTAQESVPSPEDSKASSDSSGYELITEFEEEKDLYALLQDDKKDAAKEILVQLIEKTAQLKKFNEAEALRLRLIDIDSMALSEIIKAAEIIEEAKSSSVDQDHVLIWSELYDLLSTEEFNALYHALEHETYSTETMLVKQGDPQDRLFLINKGRVKLFVKEEENETLVKTLGHGSILGGLSFFDDSVWTLNASSMGEVEVSTLSMESVDEWEEEYLGLEAKLQDYCIRTDRVNDFFIASGTERRKDERQPLTRAIYISLLDDEGQVTDTVIHGDCNDISVGGISFLSRITQRKQARTLLGRHVKIFFKEFEEEKEGTSYVGTVVAVRNLHSLDLGRSVHIDFDEQLEQKKMMDLIDGK